MMDLDTKKMVFIMKMIYLNAEMFIDKTMIVFISEINSGGIDTTMTLINYDTMVLLQIVVLRCKI